MPYTLCCGHEIPRAAAFSTVRTNAGAEEYVLGGGRYTQSEQSTSLDQQATECSFNEAGSSPGGERRIFTRCRRIWRTCSCSVITARIRIGAEHRGQTSRRSKVPVGRPGGYGSTSYTWAISFAHSERAFLVRNRIDCLYIVGLLLFYAAIIASTSAGEFVQWKCNPHAVLLEGGFDREGRSVHVPSLDLSKLSGYFCSCMVAFFLKRSSLNERLARNMLDRAHGGFSEYL